VVGYRGGVWGRKAHIWNNTKGKEGKREMRRKTDQEREIFKGRGSNNRK